MGLGEVGDNLSMADMMALAGKMEDKQVADDDMEEGDIQLNSEDMKDKQVVEHSLVEDKKLLMEALSIEELGALAYPHMVEQMEHG